MEHTIVLHRTGSDLNSSRTSTGLGCSGIKELNIFRNDSLLAALLWAPSDLFSRDDGLSKT
jgi:hypothetical protein